MVFALKLFRQIKYNSNTSQIVQPDHTTVRF